MKNKWYEKMWVKCLIGIVVAIFAFFGIPMIVKALYSSNNIFQITVDWAPKDALSYSAAIISSISSIILGAVAFKQNRDLSDFESSQNERFNELQKKQNDEIKELQEAEFISNNACMFLIDKIEINNKNKKCFSSPEDYNEQVVYDRLTDNNDITELMVKLKGLINLPSGVRIHKLDLYSEEENIFCAEHEGRNEYFSRIAISESYEEFKVIIVSDNDKREKLFKGKYGNITVEITMDLVTPEKVLTSLICKSCFAPQSVNSEVSYKNIYKKLFWNSTYMIEDIIYM